MEDARTYRPPDLDAVCRLETLRELVRRYKGRRAVCLQHRAAFMWSAYLMGLDNLLASMVADRKLAELVMDKVLEANMKVAQNAIRAGADIVMLGDDFAHNHGPMMSPALFKELILPRLRKMIAMIHDEGAFCIKHTDGNIYTLLDMILDAGPDGLHPIEPVAGMELREVKRLAGHRVCLAGNIDCAHLLPHGSPEAVREAVRQAIADAGEGGGYMVSSSNSVHSSCKAQNLIAMVEAAKQYGSYGTTE
jgi:uroporphyrinogen decarboxylase